MAGIPALPEGRQPSQLEKLFPILSKEADPAFAKAGKRFAYGINSVLAVTSAFVLAEIIFDQPWQRMLIQIIRAFIFLILSIATGYTISKGHSAIPVRTWFYVVKLLVVIVFNMAITIAQWRRNPPEVSEWRLWDWINILLPLGLGLLSLGLLLYRVWKWFKSRDSTVALSMVFTFVLCVYSFVVSMASAFKARRQSVTPAPAEET